ncbi:alpha/beta hydrolase [Antribacter gilvus]|uniref:alpha/beta hydrolase n=1 Tax=Antribacter gilvus TaxID=2304675 RepID=UPI000F7A4E34|nr:alpha/beta hydrolase [Antribacter gilvus]
MSSWQWHTTEGDPARVATLLPGSGYTTAGPLLHYARVALSQQGWTVRALDWLERPDTATARSVYNIAVSDGGGSALPGARHLVVAKSLGTLALPAAARLGVPGVWLTPVLTGASAAEVRTAVIELGPDHLLVGGTADPLWDGAVASTSAAQALEIQGADHSLEIEGGWQESLAVLERVTAAIEEFARAAGADRAPGADQA